MSSVQYGSGSYKRSDGNFPPLELINMFVESAKTSEGGTALMSRKGLGLIATNGSGPINGIYSKRGTFGGDVFSISGTALYRGTSAIASGTIAGTGVASWAGSDTELLVTRESTMRSYKATGIANVTFPDSAPVRAICFIGSLFVAIRGGGAFPGRLYWSALLDGRTWDGLHYFTAEREPDEALDVKPLGDNIWIFGQQTVEAWAHTGDADLPFTRLENVAFDKGIMCTGAVCNADNSLIFVGSDRCLYRVAEVPEKISDNSIDERIADSTTCRLFTVKREGHEFVFIRLDDETLVYDCSTREFWEAQSSGGQWIASCATMQDNLAYFGHQSTGQLMGWDGWDDMGAEMERRFTAAQQLDAVTPIDRVCLWANTGETELLSGQGSDPVVEMRISDDAGRTWGDYEAEALGPQGAYRTVPEWRALGLADFPGVMMDFRVTDPIGFRVSAVKVNDLGGGRSR